LIIEAIAVEWLVWVSWWVKLEFGLVAVGWRLWVLLMARGMLFDLLFSVVVVE
jgi:hypothetical protein